MIHLDTHVALWLYTIVDQARIPGPLLARLDREPLSISPIVRLELTFLHEIGRFRDQPGQLIDALSTAMQLRVDDTPFPQVIEHAERLAFIRDPFDRIIAAQALTAGAELATKDRRLREHLDVAIWD